MRGADAGARRGVGGKMSWKNKVYHARSALSAAARRGEEERTDGEDESGGCFGSVSGMVCGGRGGRDGRSVRKSKRERERKREREKRGGGEIAGVR